MEWLYVPVYQKRASYPLVLGFFILYGCSYRSASMSHTVNTTWISSVDFKLGQTTQLIKDWSIFNHLCPSRSSNHNRAITTAPISVKLWIIQTRKSNVFFEKKNCGGHRNVQEFSKLTLFLNFDFFLLQEIPLHAAHISWTRPSITKWRPEPNPNHLTPFDLWPNTVECIRPLIVSFYLFYETHSNSW